MIFSIWKKIRSSAPRRYISQYIALSFTFISVYKYKTAKGIKSLEKQLTLLNKAHWGSFSGHLGSMPTPVLLKDPRGLHTVSLTFFPPHKVCPEMTLGNSIICWPSAGICQLERELCWLVYHWLSNNQQIFVSWGLLTRHMSVFPMNKLSQCRGMIKNLTRTELRVELMVWNNGWIDFRSVWNLPAKCLTEDACIIV